MERDINNYNWNRSETLEPVELDGFEWIQIQNIQHFQSSYHIFLLICTLWCTRTPNCSLTDSQISCTRFSFYNLWVPAKGHLLSTKCLILTVQYHVACDVEGNLICMMLLLVMRSNNQPEYSNCSCSILWLHSIFKLNNNTLTAS